MKVQFDESFYKSIKKINDRKLKNKLQEIILDFDNAENLSEIPNIKKMQGFENYYQVRIGDYRVGFELLNDKSLLFLLVAHRKEIYRYFP